MNLMNSVAKRLKFLGLTRLDKRRIRSDLVETLKILNGFYNINKGNGGLTMMPMMPWHGAPR